MIKEYPSRSNHLDQQPLKLPSQKIHRDFFLYKMNLSNIGNNKKHNGSMYNPKS